MVAIAFTTVPPTHRRPVPTAATFRRRRLVVAMVAVLALAVVLNVAATLLGVGSEPAGVERARPVVERSVVVQPGDTIWSIAAELAEGDDVRPVVDALVDANGGSALQAGERLVIALP
jgi:cell division protein YceG involved in septum cleavage